MALALGLVVWSFVCAMGYGWWIANRGGLTKHSADLKAAGFNVLRP